MKYFPKIFISFVLIVLFASCASLFVKGDNPVERAISVANLLLEGKISDSYIKVYAQELALAEQEIEGMITRARTNEIGYTAIADNVSSWIALYSRVQLLHDLYPEGLQGKKEFLSFEVIDYTDLEKVAYLRAAEALYAKAQNIDAFSGNNTEQRLTALDYLRDAKKYSDHLNAKINALGAEICYSVAEKLSTSNTPENLLWAMDLYAQSYDWIPNYKNAMQKMPTLKKRVAALYIEAGDEKMEGNDYRAFRNAKNLYAQAEKSIPNIATLQLTKVNKLLTINLLVLFGGWESDYPNRRDVVDELQQKVGYNSAGPENLEVHFTHMTGAHDLLFANTSGADLVLIPVADFGMIVENLSPIQINKKNVYESVDGIMYEGTIIESVQKVTIFFKNNVVLYDRRGDWNTFNDAYYYGYYDDDDYDIFNDKGKYTFEVEGQKTTKTFISRTYEGEAEAKPEFNPGIQYVSGQYAVFFPNFQQAPDAHIPITESFGTLNSLGNEICELLENLEYKE